MLINSQNYKNSKFKLCLPFLKVVFNTMLLGCGEVEKITKRIYSHTTLFLFAYTLVCVDFYS